MNILRVLMVACALAMPVVAQTSPIYDAVSVKPNKTGGSNTSVHTTAELYQATNVSLKNLLAFAYGLQSEDMVSGLPGWAGSERFDITAKVDADTIAAIKAMSRDDAAKTRRMMLRTMLQDRFKLKAHTEMRQEPIYLLVVAKSGFKLKDADPNNTYANGVKGRDGAPSGSGSINIDNGHMVAQGIPISSLIVTLVGQVHRMVVDKTGLTGKYDFTVDLPHDEPGEQADPAAPSLFTVLQEQFGLKLEPTKGPVAGIVVDHLEQPSGN